LGSARIVFGSPEHGNTIVENVSSSSELLDSHSSNIFPVVPFTSTEDAFNIVEKRLGHVLSIFANDKEVQYFASELNAGYVVANDWPLELLGVYFRPLPSA
jgi:acyl-CoA reductase-like NAD-dependent aldehyde dehydrogenase